MTIPLGVLKTNDVTFSPALPDEKKASIARVGVGKINKVFMLFDSAFWPTDTQYFGWHSPQRGRYSYFLSYRKFSSINCLVTFGFGEQGAAVEAMTEAQIIADVTPALRTMFGANTPAPRRAIATRWNGDPFARGAYSFTAVNSGYDDFVALAAPVGTRLLFAGEHTHEKYRATVHGAYLSGEREADRILATAPASSAMSDADRVLNWTESLVPDLLRPRGTATLTTGPYTYRVYSATGLYLVVQDNGDILFWNGQGAPQNLGKVAIFLPQVAAAGY